MMELFAYFGIGCAGTGLYILSRYLLVRAIESRAEDIARDIVRKTSEADHEYMAVRFKNVWDVYDKLKLRLNAMETHVGSRLDSLERPASPRRPR